MKKKIQILLRDILFLFFFLLLIRVLVRRVTRFVTVHKASIIHELDHLLINQLETTKNHCAQTMIRFDNMLSIEEKNQIISIKKTVETLEEQYKKNSHALLLLGPIGTISIVLKERKIKFELLMAIKELNKIIAAYTPEKEENKSIKSIEEGIFANQQLLF